MERGRVPLITRTRTGTKQIPAGQWYVNRNTPVGEPADFYAVRPYGGMKPIDIKKVVCWCGEEGHVCNRMVKEEALR